MEGNRMAGNKILIIDADAASRNFVGAALQKAEYQILQAASGKEGLIIAWRDHPDLIIVEPTLSDLKGEDFATRLRQDSRTTNTSLVALSSDSQVTRVRSCMHAAFNEYFKKSPQAITELTEIFNRLLGIKAAAQKVRRLLIVFLSAKGGP